MEIKSFDENIVMRHKQVDRRISVGKLGEMVGHDLLESTEYEGFDIVMQPIKRFQGQPFDRICKRGGVWYIVEIKAGRRGFGGGMSDTQKQRMEKVLCGVNGVEPGLLQIDLQAAKYKIRYSNEVRALIAKHDGKKLPINNIIDWVKGTVSR